MVGLSGTFHVNYPVIKTFKLAKQKGLLTTGHLGENQQEEGCTSFMGVNQITFTVIS